MCGDEIPVRLQVVLGNTLGAPFTHPWPRRRSAGPMEGRSDNKGPMFTSSKDSPGSPLRNRAEQVDFLVISGGVKYLVPPAERRGATPVRGPS